MREEVEKTTQIFRSVFTNAKKYAIMYPLHKFNIQHGCFLHRETVPFFLRTSNRFFA